MVDDWKWLFLGFESLLEGRPVQKWFRGLPEDHRDEIVYLLLQLQNVRDSLWRRPEFDRLKGAGGISEIIVPDIRHAGGVACYRIYGYAGPGKHEYTFLHGTNKKVKNDLEGKRIAKERLDQIRCDEARVHKFNF